MRQPKLTIAVGKKGIGKTYTTEQLLNQYVRGGANFKGRKVLILDVNNEFTSIKTLPLKYVPAFTVHPKIQARRITSFKDNGEPMNISELQTALGFILKHFYGGLLLIEDINRYISDSIKNDLVGTLATQRHHNLDIIIHYQSKGKAGNPKLVGMMNLMRIHKTNDFFEKHKDKFADHIQILKIAEMLVNLENKKRPKKEQWFYAYVNFDTGTIEGDFTEENFREAIKYYVSENESETIKPLLNRKDKGGKKIFTYESAFSQISQDLLDEYFGNKK